MAKSIDRYFQLIGSASEARPSGRLWYPAADVYQTTDGWLVKVELAGVSATDLQIEIEGNFLRIAGCRRDKTCAVGMNYRQMEITYSQFEKSLEFPKSIEKASMRHDYEDGLLMIHLKTN